jgi:hypothetical protein
MSDNGVRSLREQYAAPRRSAAWEIGSADIIRFWAADGNCYGFLFHHVMSTVYLAQPNRLFIQCPLGALVISGSKVLEFYDDFSNRKVTVVKADGMDITSVEMLPRPEKEE